MHETRSNTPMSMIGVLLLAAAGLAGCNDQETQIARLVQEVAVGESENQRLRLQLQHQSERAAQFERQLAEINRMPPDRWELVPKPGRIEIDGYSGLRRGKPSLGQPPTTQPADGPVDLFARIYLKVLDGDGFPMRAAGPMTIALFDLTGDQPRSLGAYRFDAAEASRRYRSSLGTQLFAFDVPVNAAPRGEATVRVEFIDLLTGRALTAEKPLKLSE